MALSTNDLIAGAGEPLLGAFNALDWTTLSPMHGRVDLTPLVSASPSISTAANTVQLTYERLSAIDRSQLVPQISEPLSRALGTLDNFRIPLRAAADASRVLPSMMGSDGPREYLLLIQNNAELRATGGLPGALAQLHIDKGVMQLRSETSGASLGRFQPPVYMDPAERSIYTDRVGTFISDVNLTPNFPTAASAAKAMWEQRYGEHIDGVVAIDPVVLAHLLESSGPIPVAASKGQREDTAKLPSALSADNVVQVLLSDAYLNIADNSSQDAYFAAASKSVFDSLSSGKISGEGLVQALVKSAQENRLYVWSDHKEEQEVLKSSAVGGAVLGATAGGASFGVYFNDGTGAKMDYYVRREVQLIKSCSEDGYSNYVVRVKLTNTAPSNAAVVLPEAVTGGGRYGVSPGSVQTNIVVYGPSQSLLNGASRDAEQISFGSYTHSDRPVGIVTTKLSPGQTGEIEMKFVKVVQSALPSLVVTPTAQPVDQVKLPVQVAECE
ncbi:DUF4012 domain-containing protein [Pseudarthrobacter sp. LMD1-1-1.1]|uniref:DUF4012 domain-containing protein n=1 Tax=Pseudarthrobacter sp. LMD1-1-1.1 TaxID=3135242 RepID=UPI00341AFFD4